MTRFFRSVERLFFKALVRGNIGGETRAERKARFAYEQAQGALGRELKSARERAGLSVPNAATRAGIDESFWYDVERNIVFPTHTAFVKLAKAIGVDSEQLEPAYRRSYRSQAPLE